MSRRLQLAVKFFIALALSVFLGALMPIIIEWSSNLGITDWPNYWIFYAALGLFFISFYASTLTRSTLPAIGTAIAAPVIVGSAAALLFLLILQFGGYPRYELYGLSICLLCLGIPVFVLVLARLMFSNFKWLHESRRLWQTNIAAIVASFVAIYVLATAFFYRPWEWLSSLNFPRGPARLNAESPVKLLYGWQTIVAVLPNGRLWFEDTDRGYVSFEMPAPFSWLVQYPDLHSQQYIGDSDWRKITPGFQFVLGIQSNGSLWSVPEYPNGPMGRSIPQKPVQIGSDKDWLDVTREGNAFLLLKKDGSLWLWGTNEARVTSQMIKLDLASRPTSISDETNWTALVADGPASFAQKNDSSLWEWGPWTNRLVKLTDWNQQNQWVSYSSRSSMSAGINTKGQLWFMYQFANNADRSRLSTYLHKVALDSSGSWKAVGFSPSGSLILLRNNGTLWIWAPFPKFVDLGRDVSQLGPFHPVQLGSQSDWIALSVSGWDGVIALASDGSLWAWDQPSRYIWLAPSRKPVYMGNIFQSTASR